MPRPNMLNKILLKLCVGVETLNFSVCLKKCLNTIRITIRVHTSTHIAVDESQIQVSLIFNDHVVKNDTPCHYVLESFLDPKPSRTTNNGNLACKIPKALSISFQHPSCALANKACFLLLGFELVFTNVDQEG